MEEKPAIPTVMLWMKKRTLTVRESQLHAGSKARLSLLYHISTCMATVETSIMTFRL